MKQWVQKFVDQLDYGFNGTAKVKGKGKHDISEDRATLLYILDVYNKHLVEVEGHPVRKVREILDEFAKEIIQSDKAAIEKVLFRFRQFFSHYRVDEYTYIKKTFEDFKGIIWDFVDQLAEDFKYQQAGDKEVNKNLKQLQNAVDADSIEQLRTKSREFIDFYMEHSTKREQQRTKRIKGIKKNLETVKKKLDEADRSMRMDHLTSAYNRKSFDEQLKQQLQIFTMSKIPVTLIIMDIDYFKKINDTYGHDVGDFVLVECVRMLKEVFQREQDVVARIGGEEFAVILPEIGLEAATKMAEEAMNHIRKEVWVKQDMELRFTISLGIAPLGDGETVEQWLKRADTALYQSKNSGRNKYTVSAGPLSKAA